MKSEKKRRLRKKLYLGEFAVLGFEFSCALNLETEDDYDSWLDQLIEFIERRDLCMGGGGDTELFSAFICSAHRYKSAIDDDREAVKNWLESSGVASNVVIGGLVDAYYGKTNDTESAD
ncbi:MAG: 50S ribosome-binding protein YggL [Gammaproteobacteria bacterium]|nr:50S ribosome-binding protein YggL [Gammaproteobacteria bacterium]